MIVFLFPGQGSQKVGMGGDLAETPQGRLVFEQARQGLGYDLLALCREGPAEQLQRTLHTQPALYVVGCLLADLLAERGLRPGAVAGHSVGEYAALYAAGVWDFTTGLKVVARRAELMDQAGQEAGGAMAAIIGLEAEAVRALVSELGEGGILGVAAYNSDGQTVISGERERVERAAAEAKQRGARLAKVLPVSGAFHSRLMEGAAEAFAGLLQSVSLRSPSVPYVSNLTGEVETDPEQIRAGLSELLLHPVCWTDSLRTLASLSPKEYYELGPGSVLAGLLKKFEPQAKVKNVDSLAALDEAAGNHN